jgi:pimeloyl-ACP methyl ester carboxylesterase
MVPARILLFLAVFLAPSDALVSTPTPTSSSSSVHLQRVDYSPHLDSAEPPVLLLHGLLGSKRNFASLGSSLASQLDKKRRILAMDLRNHGT